MTVYTGVAAPKNWLLMSYTRTPSSREEANNEDIALSLHLALRDPITGKWEPLNENYGIYFPKGVSTEEQLAQEWRIPLDDIDLKNLKDPFIFRISDGSFAIACTRTTRGGDFDGSENTGFLFVTTPDFLTFSEHGMVNVSHGGGVNKPEVVWDAEVGQYRARWFDNRGNIHSAQGSRVTDLKEMSANELDGLLQKSRERVEIPSPFADAKPAGVLELSDNEAQELIQRFGRIYNTGVGANELTLSLSEYQRKGPDALTDKLEHVKAHLTYSDGSVGERAIVWDGKQVKLLEQAVSEKESVGLVGSSISLAGTVKQPTYPVPFAVERADPSIFSWDFNGHPLFMFIATEDEGGNCIDPPSGAHMPLRVADTIENLSDAAGAREREIDLLRAGDTNGLAEVLTGCFWAPELHVIGGRLSVLFMPCLDGPELNDDGTTNPRAGKPDMWTGRCHIMQLKKDASGKDLDPRIPENWDKPMPIVRADGSKLNPVRLISLDMTTFEDSGTSYYAWQQEGSVWIATYDPTEPTRLTADPVQIIVPEFAWDNAIAEGPNVIVHDGRLFMIYSGSLVGIDYTTGLVTAPAGIGANLCSSSAWTKLDYPLQKSGVYNGTWQLGTGHGMFSTDEDGNLLYVFHNAEYENGHYGGRDAQVRRVHWAKDGMPILDMQSSEEVDPALANVSVTVHIRE